VSGEDPYRNNNIMGWIILCVVGVMFLALVCVQVGIAKGRQMERDQITEELGR
jgi:hypothetical protein